jgi:ABC-type multidrug transport system ATPase subunit
MHNELVLEEVSKRYGQGPVVLGGLSYSFRPGTATALVGPNGSGKSTLLRLMSVLAFPTTGRIRYGTRIVHEEPYEYLRDVGIVHDEPAVPMHLSAEEVLEWILRARGMWAADGPERVATMLERVALDERRTRPAGTYSSGMLKKTQLAAALITHPDILLLDEPFRGLDEAALDSVMELLAERKQAGAIIALSSHRASIVDAFCEDRLVFPIT